MSFATTEARRAWRNFKTIDPVFSVFSVSPW
jgi:hypothetical protein